MAFFPPFSILCLSEINLVFSAFSVTFLITEINLVFSALSATFLITEILAYFAL